MQAPSDIFSLGIVLYELTAGAHPFQTVSALETPYAIATRRPEPLRVADPSLSERFSALIASMLEKDPAKRPDAASVAAELGEFVAVRGPNIVPSTRRKRLAIALVCAGMLTLAIWLATTQIPAARNTRPATAAPLLAISRRPIRRATKGIRPSRRTVCGWRTIGTRGSKAETAVSA